MDIEILDLNLLSPIFYIRVEDPDPFGRKGPPKNQKNEKNDEKSLEMLYCFDLDEDQYRNFEPDREKFFNNLVFGGVLAGEGEISLELPGSLLLPEGKYLFAQKRELLNYQEICEMAGEIQMEGLWRRLKLDKKLYLRYLFEDGKDVTKLFRPYS